MRLGTNTDDEANICRQKRGIQGLYPFYRLGDFMKCSSTMLTASKELEITLTGKNCGLEERAPMCGIPYHAVDSYLKPSGIKRL